MNLGTDTVMFILGLWDFSLFTDSYDSMQLTFAQNHFICVPHLKGVTQNNDIQGVMRVFFSVMSELK